MSEIKIDIGSMLRKEFFSTIGENHINSIKDRLEKQEYLDIFIISDFMRKSENINKISALSKEFFNNDDTKTQNIVTKEILTGFSEYGFEPDESNITSILGFINLSKIMLYYEDTKNTLFAHDEFLYRILSKITNEQMKTLTQLCNNNESNINKNDILINFISENCVATMKDALRDICKVLGVNDDEIHKMYKYILFRFIVKFADSFGINGYKNHRYISDTILDKIF